MLLKNVRLSSRSPIFCQIFLCTRKMHFDDCAETFELNIEEVLTENPNLMRKFEIVGNKSQNGAPELENAVLSTLNKQGCPWSKYFPL